MKFSDEQLLAINTVDSNVLISAGAGSGKTAVLTERIYRLVKKGTPISRFLVLTFTDAASREMKGRIRDKIIEDGTLGDMEAEVENAHIETFDAFSNFIVKKYVTSEIKIVDETILEVEKHHIIEEILNDEYLKKDPRFVALINKYCTKNDDNIYEVIKSILKVANLKIDKEKYYQNLIKDFYNEKTINDLIRNEYLTMMENAKKARAIAEEFACLDDANNVISYIDGLLDCKNYDETYLYIKDVKYPAKKSNSDTDPNAFSLVKDLVNKYKSDDYGNEEYIKNNFFEKKEDISYLLDLAKKVDDHLFIYQKSHQSYTFNDIARMALKALQDEEVRKDLSNCFDYILVDEYQDTSDIQEEVIQALGKNNVCMVGDIKQSIYAFRNANCKIFQDKYDKYKNNIGGKEIDLNNNYRSREEVVNLVNSIFLELMKKEINPIDYSNGHNFGFGFKNYNNYIDKHEKYDLKVYSYTYKKSNEISSIEAEIIADDIIFKINSGYEVYDKSQKQLRKCSFKDFALLIDRGTSFDEYRKIFAKKNIPIRVVADEKIRDSEASYICKNLLILFDSILSNKLDDQFKHSYASVARSFLLEMNDQDLYTIIKNKLYIHTEIYKNVYEVVEKYKYSSNYEILKALLEKFNFYDHVGKIGLYVSNAHKVEKFLEFISSMDELGYSLKDIIDYFNNLSTYDLEIKYADNDNAEDSVTLMTMHKSKGLEFPIVYLGGLNKAFYDGDIKNNIVATNDFGVLLPITDGSKHFSFLAHLFKEDAKQKQFEEKLRVIYVAMTRARERLIVLNGEKENQKELLDVTKGNSFAAILSTVPYFRNHMEPYQFKNAILHDDKKETANRDIILKKIDIKSEIIEHKKASKEVDVEIPTSLLDFGNELHYLLEVVDYETKDVSFINDNRLKKYVLNVINHPLFEGIKNEQILHEYVFYDEKQNINGIIDALIVLENEIRIIDFKLKNIDDSHYDEQLKVYINYIKTITDKPIKAYLISAISGEVREIEQ